MHNCNHKPFQGWVVSLSSVHLKFIYFGSLMVNYDPLKIFCCGCTTVYLFFYIEEFLFPSFYYKECNATIIVLLQVFVWLSNC